MMNDKQTLEDRTVQTYDAMAVEWAKSHSSNDEWDNEIALFKKLLPSGKILEVGCGGGRDAQRLVKQGFEYLGTDASRGMIEVAQSEVPSASFEQLSVYDLATLPTKFDGFWACAVLLHIPKQRIDEALQSINSTLRPGAFGMISMKAGDKEEFEIRDKNGRHEERLFAYWKKDDFIAALERNGFKLRQYSYRPVSTRTNWQIYFVEKQK